MTAPLCLYAPRAGLKPEDDASCWPKHTQRDQAHVSYPSISARMRKRRAFADKELENVMLERELRQRELHHHDLSYSTIVPVLHHPPVPVSPRLHCCVLNKDSSPAGTPSYVSVYKYKPVYECDFQLYQFVHLTNKSSEEDDASDLLCPNSEQMTEDEEVQSSWGVCERTGRPEEINLQQRLKHRGGMLSGRDLVKPRSETIGLMDSNGSSADTCSISGSSQVIMGGPDVSAASGTFDPAAVKGWCTDNAADPAGAHTDPVQSPNGSSVRIPAVRPLPFSVEALLRA